MCNCNSIKDIPSLLCCQCGEIQCVLCEHYNKCSSCLSFSCDKCTIKLLCGHLYCSLSCVLLNKEKKCNDYCFFIRDINATGKDEEGLKKLMDYWLFNKGVEENQFLFWLIKIMNETNDSTKHIKEKTELISTLYEKYYEFEE